MYYSAQQRKQERNMLYAFISALNKQYVNLNNIVS